MASDLARDLFQGGHRSSLTDTTEDELAEVIAGLLHAPPTVSPRWLYDDVGSALFEAITRLPEYYPTRCELEILDGAGPQIAARLPENLAVVELGAGTGDKVARVIRNLVSPRIYHPIEVSTAALDRAAEQITSAFPDLAVRGLLGDFTNSQALTELLAKVAADGPVLLFFPGSTIGNFDPDEAADLLSAAGAALEPGAPFLIGFDLVKDPALLEAAYDDPAGVTAAFNRNLLAHLNRRFGATFDPARWRHTSRWIPALRRIETWLLSEGDQVVTIGGTELSFGDGDGIHTENAHKWDQSAVTALAKRSGWRVDGWWTDDKNWFAEALLVRD